MVTQGKSTDASSSDEGPVGTVMIKDEALKEKTSKIEVSATATAVPAESMLVDGEESENSSSPHTLDSTLASQAPSLLLPPTSLPKKQARAPVSIAQKRNSLKNSGHPLISAVSLDDKPGSNRIRLGICAMDKKAKSKPMAEILSRLDESLFRVVFFGDKMILNQEIEEWPVVDVLIAFYSSGYPLEKAKRYVELRKPFLLNDLKSELILKDRRKVYDLLEASGIDVPVHVYLNRDGYESQGSGGGNGNNEEEVAEHDDYIEINGVIINKPFVEKPVDADDHNIAIYYPTSAGGGCKKLFRKIGDRSSEFYSDINEVRRDGSYIYEEFVETQGTDVKMYTVGPEYGHAEARKSPAVDGKVERNSDGKEVRFPVILTFREKEIARRIVLGFKQWVCGFDLLRVQSGDSFVSYVCDVNGWSFVKNSRKYYDDCAQILTEHMLAALKPKTFECFSTIQPLMTTTSMTRMNEVGRDISPKKTKKIFSTLEKVNCLLRGEQTASHPSEESSEDTVIDLNGFSSDLDNNDIEASDHEATTLEEGAIPVRDIPHMLMQKPVPSTTKSKDSNSEEGLAPSEAKNNTQTDTHNEELRCLITIIRHGDRTPKQKLKLDMTEPRVLEYFHDHVANCRKDLKVTSKKPMIEFLEMVKSVAIEQETSLTMDKKLLYKVRHLRDVLERWKIVGLNRKMQMKPRKWKEVVNADGVTEVTCAEVQLILKWGGNLTKLGEKQSTQLGKRLRHELYPDSPGGGILRLHSTFRHDLKIKTSDEGRVMKTAAAFAKGLLELEGEIPPILVSLVHKEKDSIDMLDPSGNKDVQVELEQCKENININLQKDFDFNKTTMEEHEQIVGPASLISLHSALTKVSNPRKTLFEIRKLVGALICQLEEMLGLMTSGDESRIEGGEGLKGDGEGDQALSGVKLYKGETLLELTERWRFLHRRLYDEEKDEFDLSRVPDVHDNVRFDMLHNPHLGLTDTLQRLYELAKIMADCVVPQEYGSTIEEKRSIGSKMCRKLLAKLKDDLIIAKSDNQNDMRYLINMDYSADLPINTMGRRVRTRLYFTSESHLHTLLNVLRFGPSDSSTELLSEHGKATINETAELCYLTQIIIRLFEDTRKDIDDKKRFRVEIMFSPGATGTPMHMSELVRDKDSTRFETSGLQTISKEGLTCMDVEKVFEDAMLAGNGGKDEDPEDMPTIDYSEKKATKEKNSKGKQSAKEEAVPMGIKFTNAENLDGVNRKKSIPRSSPGEKLLASSANKLSDETKLHTANGQKSKSSLKKKEGIERCTSTAQETKTVSFSDANKTPKESAGIEKEAAQKRTLPMLSNQKKGREQPMSEDEENERIERMARLLARQYLWKTIGVVSFVLGVGCLFMSRNLPGQPKYGRRPTKR